MSFQRQVSRENCLPKKNIFFYGKTSHKEKCRKQKPNKSMLFRRTTNENYYYNMLTQKPVSSFFTFVELEKWMENLSCHERNFFFLLLNWFFKNCTGLVSNYANFLLLARNQIKLISFISNRSDDDEQSLSLNDMEFLHPVSLCVLSYTKMRR
jgi:hypothetical protein